MYVWWFKQAVNGKLALGCLVGCLLFPAFGAWAQEDLTPSPLEKPIKERYYFLALGASTFDGNYTKVGPTINYQNGRWGGLAGIKAVLYGHGAAKPCLTWGLIWTIRHRTHQAEPYLHYNGTLTPIDGWTQTHVWGAGIRFHLGARLLVYHSYGLGFSTRSSPAEGAEPSGHTLPTGQIRLAIGYKFGIKATQTP
jgi:hypothetical protein